MVYDSMAAWDRSNFQFNDAIQSRGGSWSGDFSFEYGPGSTIAREDYTPPSPPSSIGETTHITDRIYTLSPPVSPTLSPVATTRTDSAMSPFDLRPTTPCELSDKEKKRLAHRLYIASCEGDTDSIHQLLDLGVDINTPTTVRDLYDAFKPPKPGTLSPLAGAAGKGQLDAVELLIAHGAAINPTMKQSSSAPLHQACKANDVEIARFLLEVGADVNNLNCYKTSPIMYAVKHGEPDLVQLILSYNPDLSIPSFINTAAIHWAVWPGHERNMELLLRAGADPNHLMGDGSTPLHCAALSGFTKMVKVLLSFGADPKRRNLDGATPAVAAEKFGFIETAEVLRAAEKEGVVKGER